jgi:hypothetical protein
VKKTTINAILMGIIALLSISICILLYAILTRPRYSTVSATPEPAVIIEASEENILSDESEVEISEPVALSDDGALDDSSNNSSQKGKTSTKVNIRDNASTDAKVLATVEGGTTFDIIEVQSDGWTKILYNGSIAYISSEYVILINE